MQSTHLPSLLPTLVCATILAGFSITEAQASTAAEDVVCKGCVNKNDLAANSVTNGKIKTNQIRFNRLHQTVRDRIKELEEKVAKLESSLAGAIELIDYVDELEEKLATLESSLAGAIELSNYASVVVVEYETPDGTDFLPTVRFEGANVQIIDGTGQTIPAEPTGTDGPSGLGNLIIGYDEIRTDGEEVCSDGQFDDVGSCENNNSRFGFDLKSGSHNLIVGPGHEYPQAGGAVFGKNNVINRNSATVTGGEMNIARGIVSSVSGGDNNTASGQWASVSGGHLNTASGLDASVSGGDQNKASGAFASVSGGQGNVAKGTHASVSGGKQNAASGSGATVSGGLQNTASGKEASVSAGQFNKASEQWSSVSGGQINIADGEYANVSGGSQNKASGRGATVSGGDNNTASGQSASVSGGSANTASKSLATVSGGVVLTADSDGQHVP